MLSKTRIKYIKSLQIKKYRQQEQRFTVEGVKSVIELIRSSFQVELLIVTPEVYEAHRTLFEQSSWECITVKPSELSSLGTFKTNDAVLAVATIKPNAPLVVDKEEYALALDDIRDPGNLGTILRIADWYGVTKVIASEETAELYNPKVIHASMGSFTRIRMYYTHLPTYLSDNALPVYGAFMEGEDVHQLQWTRGGIIVIGNEAHGISDEVGVHATTRITIPRYGGAESLNAAVAAAVICDNLRRNG